VEEDRARSWLQIGDIAKQVLRTIPVVIDQRQSRAAKPSLHFRRERRNPQYRFK
jgi:hypothetical protein